MGVPPDRMQKVTLFHFWPISKQPKAIFTQTLKQVPPNNSLGTSQRTELVLSRY
jgi:hypothetical protein